MIQGQEQAESPEYKKVGGVQFMLINDKKNIDKSLNTTQSTFDDQQTFNSPTMNRNNQKFIDNVNTIINKCQKEGNERQTNNVGAIKKK